MLHTEFVAHLRKLGLTQAEFARLIDVSPRMVSRWARAQHPVPGYVPVLLAAMCKLDLMPQMDMKVSARAGGEAKQAWMERCLPALEPWERLGCRSRPRTKAEAKKAYLKAVKLTHPDKHLTDYAKGIAHERTLQIKAIWERLQATYC